MEKDDKGSTLIRLGVSGWGFLLVPAYPGCPGSKAVKRSLLLLLLNYVSKFLRVAIFVARTFDCRPVSIERIENSLHFLIFTLILYYVCGITLWELRVRLLCCYSSHFLITLAIGTILVFMVLRNVVKIQMPNPTDMFVSNLSVLYHYYWCLIVVVCLVA